MRPARPDAGPLESIPSDGLEVNVSSSNIGAAHEAFGAGEPLAKVGIT